MTMMMNDLLKIQKGLGSPKGGANFHRADDDGSEEDGIFESVSENFFILPVNCSHYHKGYTTKHWLSVFRAAEVNR